MGDLIKLWIFFIQGFVIKWGSWEELLPIECCVPLSFFVLFYIKKAICIFEENILVAEPDRLNGEFRLIGIHIIKAL